MQEPGAPPRDALTSAQVVALIQDSTSLRVGYGAELLTMGLGVVEDISADLLGGSVARNSYATLHGTCQLALTRELEWSAAIVRPYVTLTSAGITAQFRLGAYYTSAPTRTIEETPLTWDVAGVDILHGLASPVGGACAVTAGTSYLAAVEQILTGRGYSAYLIDQSAAASVLPTDRVWVMDDQTRWLTVVNDLLASVGYQGIWSDWDGRLRCQPYQPPRSRAAEWVYTTDASSMLGPQRTVERDYFEAANRWVFYRSNSVDDVPPVEGNGVFTFVNFDQGDTSVNARGRVITAVVSVDAADQAALVQQAQIRIDADLRLKTTITTTTAPNPLHWHFDRLTLVDPKLGPSVDVLGAEWTLPLSGGDMSHTWTVIG